MFISVGFISPILLVLLGLKFITPVWRWKYLDSEEDKTDSK